MSSSWNLIFLKFLIELSSYFKFKILTILLECIDYRIGLNATPGVLFLARPAFSLVGPRSSNRLEAEAEAEAEEEDKVLSLLLKP